MLIFLKPVKSMMTLFVFVTFKEDMTQVVIPASAYADTFLRQFIDKAGKLVRYAGKLVMKVNKVNYVRLKFVQLYEKCRVELPQRHP